MKRPNTSSVTAVGAGVLTAFVILFVVTRMISWSMSSTHSGAPTPLFTNDQIHQLQGLTIILGAMLGTAVTSAMSPGREIQRSMLLGVTIIVIVALAAVRSYTQSVVDMTHLIIYTLTIPCTFAAAQLTKRLFGDR